ncbi:MAG TPA: CHAT domain-containing protein [Candidatus Dormibacteraeota bacterium]|nr:CHAT domain-containing protein [Candidatus Dormibacteraeota bacterium]
MTRPFDKHLDSDELDRLVSLLETNVSGSEQLSEPALREVQRHVESCQDCSRKLRMHQSVQSEILRMRVPSPSPPTPKCMGDAGWLEVAAGLLPEAKTRELMKHAAQCGHCGPLLKKAAEVLVDEATPGEEALLASLQSARPEWRENMVATLRDSARDRQQKPSWWRASFAWPAPAYAFAGIVAVAVIAWVGVRALHSPSVEQLLAQAYSEHRTLEVRIPGAKYAPVQAQRGTERSDFDKPQSLLKAEDLIGENLRKNPNDPIWLQARARAELLDGNYESAITSLQQALEAQPDSPGLLTDLGSAYFVRAESADRPIDYGNAIESFGKALAKSPDDPIALFNRALACERMFLYTQAVDDWQHYLRIDPQGDWSNDARRRLAALKEKLQQHEKSQSEPLLSPAQIAKAGTNDSAVREKMDERIEDYLRVAITDWLPRAFPAASEQPSLEARTALSELADIDRKNHGDAWLPDLLNGQTLGQFSAGLKVLAASLRANERGDYSEGQRSARSAALMFRAAANAAGELRAQAEEVYSDHLLWEGPQCLTLLNQMVMRLRHDNYRWIDAQMSLERSNCANAIGDLGTYETAIGKGLEEAERHKYPSLSLRAWGFQALSHASLGETQAAFSNVSKGLELFWSTRVDLMKGYNLYYDLDSAADGLRLPNFQVIVWREACALIDRHPDVLLRAMAHRWYGSAAYVANEPTLAAAEFSKASALFAASPKTAATARDHMDAEVWLAQTETRQGDLDQAATRLQSVKADIDGAPSFDPEIVFYTAQAGIAMRRSDSVSAEAALRCAIFLAEWALNSFPSETGRREWAEQTRNAYRNLVEWKLRQGDATSALELWEWYRGAELRASDSTFPHLGGSLGTNVPPDPRDAPPLPSPNVVTAQLPLLRDETVIAYGTFPDGIAVWAYDDRGVSSRWIPTSLPPVQDMVIRFQRLCSDRNSDIATLRISGRALYDLLIGPVEERLAPGRTIVFEPDDFLEDIPWEALVDPSTHYLLERSPIFLEPALYRTMHLRPASSIAKDVQALIVSVPAAKEEGLTPLVDADIEAQAVANGFQSAHWLQGTNATLSAIRNEIRGSVVFHFAGHAISSPQRSGLLLAEIDPDTQLSRLLGADSFKARETGNLQLAVLSACETEKKAESGSSGTENLAQSLLHAGVPHVVASRWNVDSRETAEFMKNFYAELWTGNSVSNSIHKARLTLASQSPYAHPYYWAAFALTGRN